MSHARVRAAQVVKSWHASRAHSRKFVDSDSREGCSALVVHVDVDGDSLTGMLGQVNEGASLIKRQEALSYMVQSACQSSALNGLTTLAASPRVTTLHESCPRPRGPTSALYKRGRVCCVCVLSMLLLLLL